ncbi:hypothetical protein CUMW_265000 [Citrus unshiu]|uniref:Uncharacterized protein n=1 Tax=Citrus unshiu TaxID=55188 RepID=A0A2H5QV94_CITUN|nr:hypothetical protein CUMW_265000 [Citrus unshiu]
MAIRLRSSNSLIEWREWKGGPRTGLFPYLHHLLQSLHQVLRLASKPTPNAATMEEETQMGAVEVRLPDQKQSGRNLSQKTPSNDRRPPQTDDRRRLHQDARVPYDYGGGKKSGGNALQSEVLRLREEIFLVDAGLGTPRICMQDEPTGVPINRATRFENKAGSLDSKEVIQ